MYPASYRAAGLAFFLACGLPSAWGQTPGSPSPTPGPSPSASRPAGVMPSPSPAENFVDTAYRGVYALMSGQIRGFDRFFGDPTTFEMENATEPWIRVRVGMKVKEYDGASFTNSFGSSIPLPILEKRLHAFFSNQPDDTEMESAETFFKTKDSEKDNFAAGFSYYAVDRTRFKFNLSGGIRFQWPPQPYVKPRAMYSFDLKPFYCRATQYVYWYLGDGLGEKTSFETNLPLGTNFLLQAESEATYDYDSSGVDLSQGLALMYLDKDTQHGENYAVSLEGNIYAHTWTACKIDEYNVIARFYHKIWRDWLRIGVAAGLRWERMMEDGEPDYWRRLSPLGAIFVEILFDSEDDLAQARVQRFQ